MLDGDPIVYDYNHAPTIFRFAESPALVRALMGPFGSGKSSGCVMELIALAQMQPIGRGGKRRARYVCVRNTYRQLEDTTMRTVEKWLPPQQYGRMYAHDHSYMIDRLAPDLEIELLFRALDRPEHLANLLSLDISGAWVNEAREVPFVIIKGLLGRIGRFPEVDDGGCVRKAIILDTNAPDDESWFYKTFEEKKPEDWELFRQPSGRSKEAENLPFLPPRYYEDMMKGADAEFIRVYVDAEYGFVRDGKPVYPDYVDRLHCLDIEYQPGLRIYRGWDFGLTPACVFSQVLPDGRWNTFDELCADDEDIYTFAEKLLEHCADEYPHAKFTDIGDPAGTQRSPTTKMSEENSCFKILHGLNILVEPGEQTLTIRVGAVRKALATLTRSGPKLAVHSRCRRLRKGYQGRYQYRRIRIAGAEERFVDEPDKNEYSHPHDANQYVAARLFGDSLRHAGEHARPRETWRERFRKSQQRQVTPETA